MATVSVGLLLTSFTCALSLEPNTNEAPSEQLAHAEQVHAYAYRAKAIVIPSLKCRDMTIHEVIEELIALSIEHDPDGHGISFVLNLNLQGSTPRIMPRITLSMGKTSVLRAVKLITSAANLTYQIEPYAIVIRSLQPGEKTQ